MRYCTVVGVGVGGEEECKRTRLEEYRKSSNGWKKEANVWWSFGKRLTVIVATLLAYGPKQYSDHAATNSYVNSIT